MEKINKKQIEINSFNNKAEEWGKNIPKKNYEVALDFIEKFHIGKNNSVLDVACGTGILFSILKDRHLSKYVAIDIAGKMVKEFLKAYPEADVTQGDFESTLLLENKFDYIIIYNSIPHFNDLNMVFENAYNNLNQGGKFIIAHSKTREGLKEHHRNIGYVSDKKEPIPNDTILFELSLRHKFRNVTIKDNDYFCFSCEG